MAEPIRARIVLRMIASQDEQSTATRLFCGDGSRARPGERPGPAAAALPPPYLQYRNVQFWPCEYWRQISNARARAAGSVDFSAQPHAPERLSARQNQPSPRGVEYSSLDEFPDEEDEPDLEPELEDEDGGAHDAGSTAQGNWLLEPKFERQAEAGCVMMEVKITRLKAMTIHRRMIGGMIDGARRQLRRVIEISMACSRPK